MPLTTPAIARDHPEASTPYGRDVYAWAMEQARLIREGQFDAIDIDNVAEEIESVGRSQKGEIRGWTSTLVEHLLKLEASPASDPRQEWRETIRRTRLEIEDSIGDRPSLRRQLPPAERRAGQCRASHGPAHRGARRKRCHRRGPSSLRGLHS